VRTSLAKGSRTGVTELTVDTLTLRRLMIELSQVFSVDHAFSPKVGGYYYPFIVTDTYTHADFGANVLAGDYYPVFRRLRFDRVGIFIAGAGAAGARARLGVYRDEDGAPSTLVADFGEALADVAGWQELTIDLTLEPGAYWLAVLLNDATVDLQRMHYATRPRLVGPPAIRGDHYYATGVTYGPLPATFPSGAYTGAPVEVMLRVAELL